ncbi:MAG: maleylpyruvate isomerase N-terminal domain-containing protein [Dehalococcoidia bacterium]|nr:maleylpyruvate isomerase N-terminal domain-containing protein [Dehalococcoidia bacterium]
MAPREDILGRIETSRSKLDRLVLSLEPGDFARETEPGWTVKDTLAHIAAWELSVVGLLDGRDRGVVMGLEPGRFAALDETAVNQSLYELSRDRDPASVLATCRASHEELWRRLEAMDDEAFARPYSHYQPPALQPCAGCRLNQGYTREHYEEHLPARRNALRQCSTISSGISGESCLPPGRR